MKNLFKIIVAISLFSTNIFEAQQVVTKDTISGTPLSIMMDQKVSDLLSNIEDKCATKTGTSSSNFDNEYSDNSSKTTTPKISVPEKELTNAEICRRNPRISGYKIQIAVVKSNEEAREVGMFFRRRFPNMKVETDASLRPNYKVLAGSYFTKQSAASDLAQIKKFFKDATSVQYRVFCVEAK
ncbi:SPOR domain-containing protein [Kaistella flava (ex Peng et al. 2021)]|uniref:SPOR domain-containing protein n=1 Tax=Kaistella flava (ex Peng et al. 2021) TaxID=2038776 RepID=A0A7M2YA36_9FLAO|nr:SPOR domain-containing protein [Kaistella flava (ex Peng et al. 2021)]QOW10970.1 SPOR domain-containing protein [Kaistella flava (ex Peng et al. 2021)]